MERQFLFPTINWRILTTISVIVFLFSHVFRLRCPSFSPLSYLSDTLLSSWKCLLYYLRNNDDVTSFLFGQTVAGDLSMWMSALLTPEMDKLRAAQWSNKDPHIAAKKGCSSVQCQLENWSNCVNSSSPVCTDEAVYSLLLQEWLFSCNLHMITRYLSQRN